jgi:ADP-dependent NAD(P)H-hydrate dehydratase / NAD(P)H-hydrate epimerase
MMQKVFDEVRSLDIRCYEEYGLNEDILMEHAANSIVSFIEDNFDPYSTILITSGAGNNGADGIALARLLHGNFYVTLYLPFGTNSQMSELQLKRAKLIGVNIINNFPLQTNQFDIVVDALFGTGLTRPLEPKSVTIITQINKIAAYKIACDIPSGINNHGDVEEIAFKADTTITMGALKKSLKTDITKDYVGEIIVANLGVTRELYEGNTNYFLLEFDDLKLPLREQQTTHKGTFGHFVVIVGQKTGAGMLCAEAGFAFGAGLVSVIDHQSLNPPYHIMENHQLPDNTTAIAIGMGLGTYLQEEVCEILENNIPKVIDADLFYKNDILKVLHKNNVILTPHPKEFCSLLKICDLADISIETLQKDRFKYVELFCTTYPDVVLLLKGSNVLIGQNEKVFINTYGSNKLSFGGSGDVLAGLIGSLLAQGYNSLNAAISGSLAHTKAASIYTKNNYSMGPQDLIDEIKRI